MVKTTRHKINNSVSPGCAKRQMQRRLTLVVNWQRKYRHFVTASDDFTAEMPRLIDIPTRGQYVHGMEASEVSTEFIL